MLNRGKHRLILFTILREIFESDFARYLAFKGGTACYFMHGLDRFSTDLDLDLLSNIPNIDEEIAKILRKHGELKKWSRLILSYDHDDDNIKIDISRNIWKNNRYEIRNFYGTDIRMQTPETIFANMLVALTERHANRDLYDVHFFFRKHWEINEPLILERTGKTKKDLFRVILEKLRGFGPRYALLDGLGEVLDSKQKAFVKEKLIQELIGILEFQLSS